MRAFLAKTACYELALSNLRYVRAYFLQAKMSSVRK